MGDRARSQVFWLGDLNYRLADLDPEHVKTQVEQGRLDALLAYDQLRSQQRLGRAFMGYEGFAHFSVMCPMGTSLLGKVERGKKASSARFVAV